MTDIAKTGPATDPISGRISELELLLKRAHRSPVQFDGLDLDTPSKRLTNEELLRRLRDECATAGSILEAQTQELGILRELADLLRTQRDHKARSLEEAMMEVEAAQAGAQTERSTGMKLRSEIEQGQQSREKDKDIRVELEAALVKREFEHRARAEAEQRLADLIAEGITQENEIQMLREERERLQKAFEAQAQELRAQKEATDQLRAQCARDAAEFERVCTSLKHSQSEMDRRQGMYSETERRLSDMVLSNLKGALAEAKIELEDARNKAQASLAQVRAEARAEVNQVRERAEMELAEARARAEAELADARAKAEAELADANARAEAELVVLQNAADARVEQLRNKSEEALAQERADAQAEIMRQRAKFEADRAGVHAEAEAKFVELRAKVEAELAEARALADAKVADSRSYAESIIAQARTDARAALSRARVNADQEIAQIRSKAEAEIAQCRAEKEVALSEAHLEAAAQLDAANARFESIHRELEASKLELTVVKQQAQADVAEIRDQSQAELARAMSELNAAQSSLHLESQARMALETRLSESQADRKVQQAEIERLSAALAEKSHLAQMNGEELNHQLKAMEKMRDHAGFLQLELAKTQGEVERARAEIAELRLEFAMTQGKAERMSAQCAELEVALAGARGECEQSKVRYTEAERDLARFRAQAEQLSDQCTELKNEIEGARARADKAELTRSEIEREMAQLRSESERIRAEAVAEAQRGATAQAGVRERMAETEAQLQAITAREKAFQKKEALMERHEARLRAYITGLGNARNQIKQVAQQLFEEVEAGQAVHPLKDYLALTEFELTKLEVELKKTPMSSADRPRLETCVKDMVEQREFLKGLIDAARHQIDGYVQILSGVVKEDLLGPVPPIPARPEA